MVDGYTIDWSHSERRGRTAIPKPVKLHAPSKVRKARESTVAVHGARIFNLLPLHIRNEDSGDYSLFRNHLDIFLAQIPDQPTCPGLGRPAATNSLIDQIPLFEV